MVNINKKLWSFNFGCLIAGTFVWLVSFGVSAPIFEVFHSYPNFILDYYSGTVTAFAAFFLTGVIIFIMRSLFKVCASEHTFWLALPSLGFIVLADRGTPKSTPRTRDRPWCLSFWLPAGPQNKFQT